MQCWKIPNSEATTRGTNCTGGKSQLIKLNLKGEATGVERDDQAKQTADMKEKNDEKQKKDENDQKEKGKGKREEFEQG